MSMRNVSTKGANNGIIVALGKHPRSKEFADKDKINTGTANRQGTLLNTEERSLTKPRTRRTTLAADVILSGSKEPSGIERPNISKEGWGRKKFPTSVLTSLVKGLPSLTTLALATLTSAR